MGSSTKRKDSSQPKRLANVSALLGGASGGSLKKEQVIPLVRIARSVLMTSKVGDGVRLVPMKNHIEVERGEQRLGDIVPYLEDMVRESERERGRIYTIDRDALSASIVLR